MNLEHEYLDTYDETFFYTVYQIYFSRNCRSL
jgi:hypothetical protein